MIAIEIDAKQLKRLRGAVGRAGKKFPRELAAAINSTSKKTRLSIGRRVRETVNIKKAVAEKPIKIKRTATSESLVGVVSIDKERRAGLQEFAARHDKRGVSYKIDKRSGRKRINGAFMGPRPGTLAPKLNGGVFKRATKMRHPIIKLYGVSPFGAYAKNRYEKIEIQFINKYLQREIDRRIKLNILRAEGLVSK